MPRAEALSGLRILVTRPEAQANRLATLISEAGGEPVLFPTLTITPVAPTPEAMDALRQSDMVIFISPNAVVHGYALLRDLGDFSSRVIIAIGRATRAALERQGCPRVYDPGEESSSESLLAHPILEEVTGRRICIVRGGDGRELLRETLTARGAKVSYLECYRRTMPAGTDAAALTELLTVEPDTLVVTATSSAGLVNLLAMTPEAQREELLARPLVVIGTRQQAAARGCGWTGPVLAAGAGDEQIVETIARWRAGNAA